MTIDEATEIATRGYNNTLNNAQRVLTNAYIVCVLEEENEYTMSKGKKEKLDKMFEKLLNELY